MSVAKIQIIERDGVPEYAVIPYADYQRVAEALEEMREVSDFDDALALTIQEDEFVPSSVIDRLVDGDPPLRVWREHRGLTLEELARRVAVSRGYLSQIEHRKKGGTVDLFVKLAKALQVSVDELVGWRE